MRGGVLSRAVIRGAVAIPGALATLAVSLHWAQWPSAVWWEGRDWIVLTAFCVVAAISILDPVFSSLQGRLAARRSVRQGLANEVLHTALIQIDKHTHDSLNYFHIGLHVWEVRRCWNLKHSPKGHLRLAKVASLRLSGTLQSSRVEWTRGKGVIGQCWIHKTPVDRNVGADFQAFESATAQQWDGRDEHFRLGMTWDEFQRVRSYGGVLAAPMLDADGGFRGCVSLDGPKGTYKTLSQRSVKAVLTDTANVCAERLYD